MVSRVPALICSRPDSPCCHPLASLKVLACVEAEMSILVCLCLFSSIRHSIGRSVSGLKVFRQYNIHEPSVWRNKSSSLTKRSGNYVVDSATS